MRRRRRRTEVAVAANLRFDMEPSPLTRQPQPDVFQPKIVQLYESLFKVRFPSSFHGAWSPCGSGVLPAFEPPLVPCLVAN